MGTAAVGALLQNRLVSTLAGQASARAAALPPQVRHQFVTQIHNSANNGIQVGAGQNGGSTHQFPGAPPGLVAQIARIAHDVFTFAFVTAMKQTMILPIVLLAVGALSCLAIKGRGKAVPREVPEAVEEAPTRA
jgi:hypothetical protein